MKRYLLGIFCVLAVWATSTGVSQTVRSLGYDVSNNTILWTNTNGITFPQMLTVAGTISALRISNSTRTIDLENGSISNFVSVSGSGRSINFLTGTINGFTGLGSGLGSGDAITASNITVSSFAPNGGLLIGSTATGQLYTHTNLGVITTNTYVIGNTGTNLTNWTTESMPERIGAQSATRWFNIAAVTNTTNFLPRHRYLSCYYNLYGATGTNTLMLPTNNVVTGDIIGVYPYYANADGTNVAIHIVSYTRQFVTTPFTGWGWTTNLVTNTVRRSPNSSDISYFQFAEGSGWNQVEPQLVRNDTEVPVINPKAGPTILTNLGLQGYTTNSVTFAIGGGLTNFANVTPPNRKNLIFSSGGDNPMTATLNESLKSLDIGGAAVHLTEANTGAYYGLGIGFMGNMNQAVFNGSWSSNAIGLHFVANGYALYFGSNNTTGAAITRSNLGLPLSTLTNTSNVTMMRALAGVTYGPVSDSITLSDGSSNWILTFSNGILVSIEEL